MNTFARLRLVRAILVAGVTLRALAWGAAAALTLIVGVALADMATPLPLSIRVPLLAVAAIAALSVAAAFAWRDRTVLTLASVALWIEERTPSLEYTLVTAVETGDDALLRAHTPERWASTARHRVVSALRVPAAIVVVIIVVVMLMPRGAVARVRNPHPGDSIERATATAVASTRLAPLVGEVVPPAYSGEKSVTVDEPGDVHALAGSTFTLRGRGDGSTIVAHVAGDSSIAAEIRATTHGDRWEISLRVPSHALAVKLADRTFSRVVVVEPVIDNPPIVTLLLPARDSVLRIPKGRIALTADASDDFGISSASFEYIVSSGEGETFTFKSGVLGAVKPSGARTSLSSSLSIDSLGLKPGDIVHVRAVARDANNVSGPGIGSSETRSIRIARADEYDSVSVDPAAPSEADKSVISERMLIVLTEVLDKKRTSLKHDTLIKESHAIAMEQTKLRRSVGELVFSRLGGDPSGEETSGDDNPARAKTMQELLARADAATNRSSDPIDFEGGESPVVAVNKPLLEAYNAMWDASTSLEMGETNLALPHMRRALAAIQKARQAERVYMHGTPPAVIVDLDKVRLKGKDKGSSSVRRGLAAVDSAERARADRFAHIVELSVHQPQAAADSLLLLRIDVLGDNAAFAAALGDAANAIRRGRSEDATSALVRARRALSGASVSRDSLSRWGFVP